MVTKQQPLAEQLRPHSLEEFVGQQHLVGSGKPLRRAIEQDRATSMILWGPPGVGKTTLARIIAAQTKMRFVALSAVSAGKSDMRQVVEMAQAPTKAVSKQRGLFDEPTDAHDMDTRPVLLFLDEIHRFNKAQQDFLLPYVEDGTITLIGATTENPSFEVISALLSRMQVFVLKALTEGELRQIITRATTHLAVHIDDDALAFLANYANGDARAALNLLNNAVQLYSNAGQTVTVAQLRDALQSKQLRYDKTGEEHYNTISAFIKSMRASDPDAALYYLARMVDAGEDPKYIARRMIIFASEDVGMAEPMALIIANEVFKAVEVVGLPEAQINLAHGVTYLATAPKSRASYEAYFRALDDVKKHGNLPVPMHLRNAPTQMMREMGYGERDQASNLPDALSATRYYQPNDGMT